MAVAQHVGQAGGLLLGETAGDLGLAAGDRALVDQGIRDDLAVEHDRQRVEHLIGRVAGAPGAIRAEHRAGNGAERVGPRAVEGEVDLPAAVGGAQRRGGAGHHRAEHGRLGQHDLVAVGIAGHGLAVRVVPPGGVVAVDLLLPVGVGAVQLVEQRLHRRADQRGVPLAVSGRGKPGAGRAGTGGWAGRGG